MVMRSWCFLQVIFISTTIPSILPNLLSTYQFALVDQQIFRSGNVDLFLFFFFRLLFYSVQELFNEKLISWKTRNEKLTRELCNRLLIQLKEKHLEPVLRQLQGKEAAKMSFDEIIDGYNHIKEDYHNSALGAKDVIAAVFFEFHPVGSSVEIYHFFRIGQCYWLDQSVKVKSETDIRQSFTSKKFLLAANFNLLPVTCYLSHSHGDRWGATDIATLSLHLILFSASLRALQNFNPVHSEILFSQRFFCLPLLLPPCTVPCRIVLESPDDLDTCPNHFNLRFFTVVKISSQGPMACLILSLTASLVM